MDPSNNSDIKNFLKEIKEHLSMTIELLSLDVNGISKINDESYKEMCKKLLNECTRNIEIFNTQPQIPENFVILSDHNILDHSTYLEMNIGNFKREYSPSVAYYCVGDYVLNKNGEKAEVENEYCNVSANTLPQIALGVTDSIPHNCPFNELPAADLINRPTKKMGWLKMHKGTRNLSTRFFPDSKQKYYAALLNEDDHQCKWWLLLYKRGSNDIKPSICIPVTYYRIKTDPNFVEDAEINLSKNCKKINKLEDSVNQQQIILELSELSLKKSDSISNYRYKFTFDCAEECVEWFNALRTCKISNDENYTNYEMELVDASPNEHRFSGGRHQSSGDIIYEEPSNLKNDSGPALSVHFIQQNNWNVYDTPRPVAIHVSAGSSHNMDNCTSSSTKSDNNAKVEGIETVKQLENKATTPKSTSKIEKPVEPLSKNSLTLPSTTASKEDKSKKGNSMKSWFKKRWLREKLTSPRETTTIECMDSKEQPKELNTTTNSMFLMTPRGQKISTIINQLNANGQLILLSRSTGIKS